MSREQIIRETAERIAAAQEAFLHDPCSPDDCCIECNLVSELTRIAREIGAGS